RGAGSLVDRRRGLRGRGSVDTQPIRPGQRSRRYRHACRPPAGNPAEAPGRGTARHGTCSRLPRQLDWCPFHGGKVMAAKGSGPLTKAVAVILTGVVVPVLVDLAQKNILDAGARAERGRGEHAPSPGGEAARPAWRPVPTKAPRPAEATYVIAHGVG